MQVIVEGATVTPAPNMELKFFQKLDLKVVDGMEVKYRKTMVLKAGGQIVKADRVKPNSNVR